MRIKVKYMVTATFLMVVLLLSGCSNQSQSLTFSDAENQVILDYLDNKVMAPNFGGKVFSAYKLLSTDSNQLYVWASIQEYYKKDGILERGSGCSVPLVLNVKKQNAEIVITNHTSPRDGSLYSEDIKKLFPRNIQKDILFFPSNSEQIKGLGQKLIERANQWVEES